MTSSVADPPIAADPPTGDEVDTYAGPRADTLAGSLLLVLGLTVLQRGLGFVREILFCRWLDQEQLGQWAMSLLFVTSAAAIVSLGIQGSMNRYLAYYRSRGQLKAYLRRVALVSGLLAVGGGLAVWLGQQTFSQIIFGSADRTDLVVLIAAGVAIVMANNFLVELFTALRMLRVVSALQLINSLGFVVLSIGLMLLWQPTATSLVIAFVAAYLAVIVGGAWLAGRTWRQLPDDSASLPQAAFWPKLVRFSMALWIYNCLVNLFEATDRYMIVHFSRLDEAAALVAVGNYHSARVVPVLLATLAALVASTLMPHMSHAWEAGRREEVARRMALSLKLVGLTLLAAAVAVMLAAPLLFEWAFDGKYDQGRQVLPGVLATCIWYGLIAVAFNYLWCAERLGLCAAALAIGLVVNVALNAMLLPPYGLHGAVAATAVAHLVQLAIIYALSRRFGMAIDLPLVLVSLAPAVLWLGPWTGLAVIAALTVAGLWLLTRGQRDELTGVLSSYFAWRASK